MNQQDDDKRQRTPGPHSGYRENHDPRGKPGQHQKKDGRQLPEDTDEPHGEPGANAETSVPEPVKRGD